MADLITPDLCVIGAGAGGLAAAEVAARYGASVLVIEKARPGGLSLNATSVPARALAAAAAHAAAIREAGAFGLQTEEPRLNARRLHDHLDRVIAGIAPRESAARLKALGIDYLAAEARFTDARTLAAGDTQVRPRRIILATGARPVVPAIPGLDSVPFFTTETIFDNTRKLTHLVIIGGGGTALEIAGAHVRLGAAVTVVEPGPLLPGSDPELADIVLRRLAEEGVVLRTGAEVTAVLPRSMGIGVAIRQGDDSQVLDASHILVATGRVPNLDSLDLPKAGIRREKSGQGLQLTPSGRTSNRRVYAVGDAVGGPQSAHFAALAGEGVAREILFGLPYRPRPDLVPRLIYTDPELAEIGTAGEPPAGATVTRLTFAENDRARADRTTYGSAKLVTDGAGRILGAGVVGKGAGELIALVSLAMARGLDAADLARFAVPYPTYAAIIRDLALAARRTRPEPAIMSRIARLMRHLP